MVAEGSWPGDPRKPKWEPPTPAQGAWDSSPPTDRAILDIYQPMRTRVYELDMARHGSSWVIPFDHACSTWLDKVAWAFDEDGRRVQVRSIYYADGEFRAFHGADKVQLRCYAADDAVKLVVAALVAKVAQTAVAQELASWEERARGLATGPSADVGVATPLSKSSQWARHMLVLSCLTDQYCRGVIEQWSIGPLVLVEGLYHRLRRIQCKLLDMPAAQRSVLQMCASDVEGAMRQNAEAYSQTLRVEKRDSDRRRRFAGLKGGKQVVLPACDTRYHCVLCPSDGPYVASNPEQLRSHMRRKHGNSAEAERGRFRGRERNADGARQYALCVCVHSTCCAVGTLDWVRHPAASAWQASLGAGSRTVVPSK
jgi:hypothetical protein